MAAAAAVVVTAAAEAAAAAAVVVAAAVAADLTAHLGDRLTVNWHWRLIGLLCLTSLISLHRKFLAYQCGLYFSSSSA
jgi:hypothetical protein